MINQLILDTDERLGLSLQSLTGEDDRAATHFNPLFDQDVVDNLRSLIQRAALHYQRYGYTIQTREYRVALALAESLSATIRAVNTRFARTESRVARALNRNRVERIELRDLVISQAEELALLKCGLATDSDPQAVEVDTPLPNHPKALLREELDAALLASSGAGTGYASGHDTPNIVTSDWLPSPFVHLGRCTARSQDQTVVSGKCVQVADLNLALKLSNTNFCS